MEQPDLFLTHIQCIMLYHYSASVDNKSDKFVDSLIELFNTWSLRVNYFPLFVVSYLASFYTPNGFW